MDQKCVRCGSGGADFNTGLCSACYTGVTSKTDKDVQVSVSASPVFTKNDTGKLRWSLLPVDALQAIIKVLMFGAKKYTPNNWLIGTEWSRPYDALLRHITAWWDREESDPESGMSHLWHAGCCVIFLISYELRSIGTDDRPTLPPKH